MLYYKNSYINTHTCMRYTLCPTYISRYLLTVSFEAARALILREIIDPPTTHQRIETIYADDEGNQQNQKKNIQNGPRISRKEAVLLAQLRSCHCHTLAAYRNVVDKKNPLHTVHTARTSTR